MRILVTGANGQLGRDISQHYQNNGDEVYSFGSYDLDITRYQVVSSFIGKIQPDLIINCAAFNDVDNAEKDWKRAFQVNGLGPKYLSIVASKNNAAIVHFSTDYVFDGRQNRPYTIADTPNPINRYGESKLLGEQMVGRHADEYYIIRTSWVFGKGNINFVKKVIGWSKNQDTMTIVDDQISSPTYTRDLARATRDLTRVGESGLYHITNDGFCSRFDWTSDILKKTGWKGDLIPGKSEDFPTPAKRPAFSALDNFGIREAIGNILPSWQDGTSRFLQEIEET